MNIIVVDDEKYTMNDIVKKVSRIRPEDNVTGFQDPELAISYVKENRVGIAFLDMEMPKKNGIEMAKILKEINPGMNIIFATAHEKYALDAFKVRATGYVMKPAGEEEIRQELAQLQKYRIVSVGDKIRVQCFGGFDVFTKERERVSFSRKKSKELLAYLIHKKGATVSNQEAIEMLFEGKEINESTQSSLRKIISDLLKDLKAVQLDFLVVRKRNEMFADKSRIDCDYYSYLRGEEWAVNAYHYDYMPDYEWAQETNWYLSGGETEE